MVDTEWTCEVEPAKPAQEGRPSAGPVYRCRKAADGKVALTDVTTCYELFKRSVTLHGNRPCLGHRPVNGNQAEPYSYISYNEAGAAVDSIGSAMVSVGVVPNTRVGVFGANCPEWMITQQVRSRNRPCIRRLYHKTVVVQKLTMLSSTGSSCTESPVLRCKHKDFTSNWG